MELPVVDIAIVVAYLLGLLSFGLLFGRSIHSERDYFLAGRSLPFWAIGMSIVVSDIGAIDFVSLSGASYDYGLAAANMDWIGTMPAILLAAFIFVPYYWRAGVYSAPEYLGLRYNRAVRMIQSAGWTFFLVTNLGAIFWASAKMFEGLIGPELWSSLVPAGSDGEATRLWIYILLAAAFTGTYTVTGGLRAVVYTDVAQLVVMFIGAFLIVGIGLYGSRAGIGGFAGLRESVLAAGEETRNHFTLFLPHDTKTPFPWTGVFFGLALVQAPAYFIGNQAIVQRTLGARDEWSAKAGALFGGLLKLFIPLLVVVPGLIALVLYPGLEDSEKGFALLIRDLLPTGVRGVVFAAFLAAMMSSVDSILTSAATLISREISVFRRDASEKSLLGLGRLVTLGLLILGVLSAPVMGSDLFGNIYGAIQHSLAVLQGPTWAILLVGMFWRRATPAGGLVALIAGLATSVGLTVWQKVTSEDARPFHAEDPFMFIAAISFAATVAVLVAVSLVTRPRSTDELRGLVYRASLEDPEAQDTLRDRAGEEGGPTDAERGEEKGP